MDQESQESPEKPTGCGGCTLVIVLLLGAALGYGYLYYGPDVAVETVGEATFYTYPWLVRILAVSTVLAVLVGSGLAVYLGVSNRVGLFFLLGLWGALTWAPGFFLDQVSVDADRFQATSGIWITGRSRHDVRFEDLRNLSWTPTRMRSRGIELSHGSLSCRRKDDSSEKVDADALLAAAVRQIVRNANANGVIVIGGSDLLKDK